MNTCRICLAKNVQKYQKDICQTQYDKNTSYVDIIMFCLNIQITPDTKLTTRLCMKCYRKLVSFYKFKLLAIKNNEYLKISQQNIIAHETDIFTIKNEDSRNESIIQEYPLNNPDVKTEAIDTIVCNLKQEPSYEVSSDNVESDDELLSIIKLTKEENDPDFIVEDEKVKKVKGGLRTQICEECGKSVKNLKDHMRLHQPVDKRKYYQCKLCPQKYASAAGRKKHFNIKHLFMKKKCDICFKEVGNLKSHMLIVHDKSNLPFACAHCDHRCLSKSLLEIHAATHSKEKPFQCDLCPAKFRTAPLRQTHIRQVHDKEKPHMCQYCSKRFFKKNHLQLHIRMHTDERPCKCAECGKCFRTSTGLRKHELIHLNDKKYACQMCHMAFITKSGLRAHMITHTKIKRYPCSFCGVKFGRSDHRRKHERSAHLKHHNWQNGLAMEQAEKAAAGVLCE